MIDLKKLEKQLQEAISIETQASLQDWLNSLHEREQEALLNESVIPASYLNEEHGLVMTSSCELQSENVQFLELVGNFADFQFNSTGMLIIDNLTLSKWLPPPMVFPNLGEKDNDTSSKPRNQTSEVFL